MMKRRSRELSTCLHQAHGNAGQVNYAAAKAGLIGMTKSFAAKFASRNILVNDSTGLETPMTEKFTEQVKDKN